MSREKLEEIIVDAKPYGIRTYDDAGRPTLP
jgi:hypothetical protein